MNHWCTYCRSWCVSLFLLLVFTAGSRAQAARDTIPVFFPFNDDMLSRQAMALLDSVRYEEILNPGQQLLIIGYADFVGTGEYNDKLSRRRAQAVKEYLLTLDFRDANIQLCIGKGEIERSGITPTHDGYAPDRRVDIVILKKKMEITPEVQETVAESLPEIKHFAGLEKNITDYTPQETFRLENLYFPPNKHYLERSSEVVLDTLYMVLKTHPHMRIRVEGHICCVTELPDAYDDDTHTYDLSVNRAKYIRAYLVQKGIQATRIEYIGFGRRIPIEPVEDTEERARKNRRVEIRILSQ